MLFRLLFCFTNYRFLLKSLKSLKADISCFFCFFLDPPPTTPSGGYRNQRRNVDGFSGFFFLTTRTGFFLSDPMNQFFHRPVVLEHSVSVRSPDGSKPRGRNVTFGGLIDLKLTICHFGTDRDNFNGFSLKIGIWGENLLKIYFFKKCSEKFEIYLSNLRRILNSSNVLNFKCEIFFLLINRIFKINF